jgi:hypothetical protein
MSNLRSKVETVKGLKCDMCGTAGYRRPGCLKRHQMEACHGPGSRSGQQCILGGDGVEIGVGARGLSYNEMDLEVENAINNGWKNLF